MAWKMRKDLEHNEYRQMRRIAFLAVVVSTAAVISAVITLPMLYGFIQKLENHLLLETHFCVSIKMWSEITALQIGKKLFSRIKREWSFGKWMSSGSFYGDTGNGDGSNNDESSNNYGSIPIDPLLNGNYYGQCCTCHRVNH
uniref:Col_cuticle_N domain-containing protein n=1 Tax=Brugia timori TaxID=42155 RepID=A0A0R3Q4M4_9BILA